MTMTMVRTKDPAELAVGKTIRMVTKGEKIVVAWEGEITKVNHATEVFIVGSAPSEVSFHFDSVRSDSECSIGIKLPSTRGSLVLLYNVVHCREQAVYLSRQGRWLTVEDGEEIPAMNVANTYVRTLLDNS